VSVTRRLDSLLRKKRGNPGSSATANANHNRILASSEKYTIVVDPKSVGLAYNPESRTITWNPTSGLKVAAGVQSPNLALAHEESHAASHDQTTTENYKTGDTVPQTSETVGNSVVVSVGESANEARATTDEQSVSRELGGSDPARAHYNEASAADAVKVSDPAFHCRKPNCP